MQLELTRGGSTYTHAMQEVGLIIQTTFLRDEADRAYAYEWLWTIRGELQAASQAALIAGVATLEAAYGSDGFDLVMYTDATQATVFAQMTNLPAIGGTRIVRGPDYLHDGIADSEGGLYRRYEIQVAAKYKLNAIQLLAFHEEIEEVGTGGPDYVHMEPISGTVQRQQVKQATACQMRQSGYAVGWEYWPVPPLPAFPLNVMPKQSSVKRLTPKRKGMPGQAEYCEYRVEWNYLMEAEVPFPPTIPTLWPPAL